MGVVTCLSVARFHGNAGIPGPPPGLIQVQQQILGCPRVQKLSVHQLLEEAADGLALLLLSQVVVQLWRILMRIQNNGEDSTLVLWNGKLTTLQSSGQETFRSSILSGLDPTLGEINRIVPVLERWVNAYHQSCCNP